ncbi:MULTISPECIES: hypothetical protein [Streptomyces]|uniref:XRE family transcriptional regulator n=1 Tax=Streptomyces galilaeus TaxID=33899 RepID=A0ABW9IMH1_STRGJ
MSAPYPALSATLDRIRELIAICNKSHDEVLNVRRLSHLAGLSKSDVEILLAGGVPPETDPDVMVRDRVRFLYETHIGANGRRREIPSIAAGIGQTPTWTKKLVAGEAKPNILVGAQLADFYDVSPSFFTDLPAKALDRELQSILFDLEIEADPGRTLQELGVRHISGRSRSMNKGELAELAKMVANITDELTQVKNQMERLENPEGNR